MKIESSGINEAMAKLSALGKDTGDIARKTVYQGAAVVADAVKEELKKLPVQEGENGMPPYVKDGEKLTGVTRKQKGDLIDSMGIAPIQEFKGNGYIQTKIGWDGYGSVKTAAYPGGLPNQLLMRSIESGTSFRKKNPLVRRAALRVRSEAVKTMKKEFGRQCGKYFK